MRSLEPRSVKKKKKHRRGALLLPGQPHANMRVSDHPQVFDHGGAALFVVWLLNTFPAVCKPKYKDNLPVRAHFY